MSLLRNVLYVLTASVESCLLVTFPEGFVLAVLAFCFFLADLPSGLCFVR